MEKTAPSEKTAPPVAPVVKLQTALHANQLDQSDLVVRGGEPRQLWYRSDRIFRSNGQWYFHTREGFHVGPYRTQFDAEVESSMLVKKLRQSPIEVHDRIIRDHMLDTDSGDVILTTEEFTNYLVEVGGVELLRD